MRSWLTCVFCVLATGVLSACDGSLYYISDPIEAWVVDAETGKPIEGAIVTANWQLVAFGLDTGGRKLHQLEVMETVTDSKGRFHFPGFTKLNLSFEQLGDGDPRIRIFKPGYDYSGISSNYFGRPEAKGPHRHSPADGRTFRLKKEPDIRKYAHRIDMLNTDLSAVTERGYGKLIPRMSLVLNCEKQRVHRIDPMIPISVPPLYGQEVRCGE